MDDGSAGVPNTRQIAYAGIKTWNKSMQILAWKHEYEYVYVRKVLQVQVPPSRPSRLPRSCGECECSCSCSCTSLLLSAFRTSRRIGTKGKSVSSSNLCILGSLWQPGILACS